MLTLYSLLGLLALRDRLSVWWTLPPVAAATFIHIFGLTLLPSLGYLLLRRTRVGEGFAALRTKTKLLIGLATFVSGLAAYHYLCSNFYFFTFAFLPIIPDQFTVEGDSLLSVKHLLDTLNLLFLLVPGLLVLVSGLLMITGKAVFESIESRFLLIFTLSTLAAVYVFNPGIGMPRNWDLFSIVGIPLAMLCFHTLLSLKTRSLTSLLAALLACSLAGLVLAPRVVSQAQPEVAIAHFKDYLELDKVRNRNARRLLIDYYKQTGDTAAASREQTLAERDFPESAHNKRGKQHLRSGNIDRAEVEFRGAIELNPLFYDAYANLANCSITRGDLDSALVLLKIADGLNPYNASTISNIGTVLMRMNDLEKALDAFHESLRIDSLNQNAMVGLASSYLQSGQPDRSVEYVTKLHERTKMTYHYFQQATEAYLEAGFHDQAHVAYQCAVDRGLSAEDIETMITRYPQLAN
jgi:tetratricopeptide (TPR) repeat protein